MSSHTAALSVAMKASNGDAVLSPLVLVFTHSMVELAKLKRYETVTVWLG